MRSFVLIPHTIFGNDGAETVTMAVDHGCTDAAAGNAPGDNHRIHPLLGEIRGNRGVKKDQRARLAYLQIVVRIEDPRVDFSRRMGVQEALAHDGNFPIRHLTRVHIGGVAVCDRYTAAARYFKETPCVFNAALNQRRAAEWVLRVGEGELVVDDDNARLVAETDLDLPVGALLARIIHAWRPI